MLLRLNIPGTNLVKRDCTK